MSTILTFFKEHPSWDDNLHKILKTVPDLQAQLPPIRQQKLGCCGASTGKNGKIELTIADKPRWDSLVAQETAIISKLEAIDAMVAELDKIFAEVEAAGFDVADKTPRAIWAAAPRTDPPMQMGEYIDAFGGRVDKHGVRIKSVIDPKFVDWMQRAEKAMAGL
jgi:hypothetical protein